MIGDISHNKTKKINFLHKSKRSQQEIVGFVLIIVIVVVIFLIYLSFSIGKGDGNFKNSVLISNFLTSSMYYTTNCTRGYGSPIELDEAIKDCYKDNQQCDDGEHICEITNYTLKKVLGESLQIGENSPNKGYNLSIYYMAVNSTMKTNQMNIQEGNFFNCSQKPGAMYSISQNNLGKGMINVELEVCNS